MNRLRKIVRWLWLVKERIVLIVMVAILCHRVYIVIQPEQQEDGVFVRRAGNTLPPDVPGPGTPPPPPRMPPDELWSTLWNDNMMTYTPGGSGRRTDQGPTVELELVRLAETPNGWRAQISTGVDTRWYNEGEEFETYQLMSIDPENECVEVYAENVREVFEICKEE